MCRSYQDDKHQIAFLKDTWRADVADMEPEGDVVVDLVESGVPHISDIYCQGNVDDSAHKCTFLFRTGFIVLTRICRPTDSDGHVQNRELDSSW